MNYNSKPTTLRTFDELDEESQKFAKGKVMASKNEVSQVQVSKRTGAKKPSCQQSDPAMKKPNPYIIFCAQERPKIREEFPSMSFAAVAKELSNRWKQQKSQPK